MADSVSNIFQAIEVWQPRNSLFVLLITTTVIFYLQYHWKRRHIYKLANKIPGPKGWPFFGLIFDFTGTLDETLNKIMEHFTFRPGLVKIWYGPILVFLVSKPEYLERILKSPKGLSKPYLYKYGEPLVGHGLFTAPGMKNINSVFGCDPRPFVVPTWKRHNRIILRALSQKILDNFVETFRKQSSTMCDLLKKNVGKGEFDISVMINKCILDIAYETLMGIKMNAQNSDSVVGEKLKRITAIIVLRTFVFWYHSDYIFKWTKLYQEERQLTKEFKTFTEKIITQKLDAFKQNNQASTNLRSFSDLLIELSSGGDKLSEDEIKDEVNSFILAGIDTTTYLSSFVFLMLAMHKEIQDKVYQEVIEVLGEGELEPQSLRLLTYTERVIKETLRLFPLGAFIMREITGDLVLEDDVVLPNGCMVLLGFIHLHRSSDYWTDPLKFDPDRFLPEEIAKRHPFSYLPFSGGPRSCPGNRFALMVTKTVIAQAVSKFKFSTEYSKIEDIQLDINLALRPKNGAMVSIELRT